MSDFPNILSAKIVGNEINVFWDEKPDLSGCNKSGILILVTEYQPGSAEETQLQKIMQACGLQPEQYNILKLKQDERIPWSHLREVLQPKVLLLMGVAPAQLGISALLRLNTPNRFDEVLFIPSISLSDMEKHTEHKKELWLQGLKPVFVDKVYGNIL